MPFSAIWAIHTHPGKTKASGMSIRVTKLDQDIELFLVGPSSSFYLELNKRGESEKGRTKLSGPRFPTANQAIGGILRPRKAEPR